MEKLNNCVGRSRSDINSLIVFLPPDMRTHSMRVGFVANEMAQLCKDKKRCFDCDDSQIIMKAMLDGGQYHDIGKLLLPDELVAKLTVLTDTENSMLAQHPAKTSEMLAEYFAGNKKSFDESYRNMVMDMGRFHHERADGNGYPYGLFKSEIPFSARLCSVADMFDNLVIIEKLSYDEAKKEILSQSGKAFSREELDLFTSAFENIVWLYTHKTGRTGRRTEARSNIARRAGGL